MKKGRRAHVINCFCVQVGEYEWKISDDKLVPVTQMVRYCGRKGKLKKKGNLEDINMGLGKKINNKKVTISYSLWHEWYVIMKEMETKEKKGNLEDINMSLWKKKINSKNA